ncbi:MAG: type VI secretion system tube protein Hcp [Azonexus sp.]|jgi:type VI secretion system secreted protein Hcp|nr:type VI secretion system tube protein Hcp [Azonexus sp.]
MAMDFHIKFDGIDGESTHVDHKGEIDLVSWNWGLTSAPAPGGSGSGSGKPQPGALNIVHLYDKASPQLAKQAAMGKHIKQAWLTARKAGDKQKDFFKVTMKEILVTSVQVAGDRDGGMVEEVALNYAYIDFSYTPTDAKGKPGTPVGMAWDVKKGKVT